MLEQFPYQADRMLFRCRFQYTRIGVGKGNVKMLMSTSLQCLSSLGVKAAAARGFSILHLDLKGVSPTNLMSPNT